MTFTLDPLPSLRGPKGDTGDTGPANELSIGTIDTGDPGTPAAAEITGDAPAQVLNLTIPQGDQGIQGDLGPKGDTGDLGEVIDLGNVAAGNLNLATAHPDLATLASQIVKMTLTGNVIITGLPTPPAGKGGALTLRVKQDATGSRTLQINNATASFGVPITLSTAANAVDVIHLLWLGSNWLATLSAQTTSIPTSWVV